MLPQELLFAFVARLLTWQTHEAQILGETTLRSLVRRHGQLICQAEQAEVAALAAQDDPAPLELQFVPQDQPRRRAGWPKELNAAVDAALANGQIRPPDGVAWADWERVLAAPRADGCQTVEDLRHLEPRLESDQVLLTIDEVLTRRQEGDQFVELRTARIATAAGYRYFSGVGTAFLQQIRMAGVLALAGVGCLLLIADGARWIRTFFSAMLSDVNHKAMILDWYHLEQKCRRLSSRICRTKAAKAQLLRRLEWRLWRGDVPGAIRVLEAHRPEARNAAKFG
ncbi:MAG TPA: hypothetical protein VFO07_09005 [Roseiflexaceae bacterium]|nr:hypothetical protein [Roseiflexaceae bacterium]